MKQTKSFVEGINIPGRGDKKIKYVRRVFQAEETISAQGLR